MSGKRRFLKYFFFGFPIQIAGLFVSGFLGEAVRDLYGNLYQPWALFGEFVMPSGPGGHALPVGALLGILLGMIVYSIMIGLILMLVPSRTK